MKKIVIYLLALTLTGCLWSCDDDKPSGHSIFDTTVGPENEFEEWLLYNYVYPYNIEVKYKMEDIEADMKYTLAPAMPDKCIALAKAVKYLWLEAYDEVVGLTFTRTYTPRVIHMIGSGAYNTNNTVVLGTAEGGLKITLYKVNDIDPEHVTAAQLNDAYLKTMHHEFAHILHQKRNFDPSFNRISEGKYVGADWYYYMTAQGAMPRTDDVAWPDGFVTAYAMSQSNEDFVENIAMYVTHTQAYWDNMMTAAGESGAAIINKKFTIVYNYMRDTWGIDLNELRKIVLRRQQEITEIDLSTIQ